MLRWMKQGPFRALALTLALVQMAAPLRANPPLPALGDSVSAEVGIGYEKRLGEQAMRQIRPDPAYLDDPLLLEYVQRSWTPLVEAAKRMGNIGEDTRDQFAWEVFLVRDKSVNAFAMPGGYVGVHLGLLAVTQTRDELTSVLGHELSHITQRHIARGMIGDSRNSLLALAGMLAGVLVAARAGSVDMANAAIVGSQAAAVQSSLNFSRDMEREADRMGYQVMGEAGYNPAGMASMFERMEQAYHLMDSGAYPYLRTHPLTSERIGEARARANSQGLQRPTPSAEHALMAARARVLMDPRVDAWRPLQGLDAGARSSEFTEQLAARYASALASIQLRDFNRAESALRAAQALLSPPRLEVAAQRLLGHLQAELALARGQGEQGLAQLAALKDNSRAALILQAQLARVSGAEPQRAAYERLQTHLALTPQDALGWSELALLAQAQGQVLRAVRAQAEHRAALGDLNGAIDRLRSGLRQSRQPGADPIEAAVIDARLRTLVSERRALLADLYPNNPPRDVDLPQ
ncbi:M48 family metalloprotease [Roseateles sp. BYS180W]|uniref:M48 family metalloprotease n=1 Tax=Roseateles rivi TaxID=3299028 RepID=A0ABW7FT11_9BURK